MSGVKTRLVKRTARQARVRRKVRGTTQRPRLCVFRSARHIYVQVIDDTIGRTLAEASTRAKGFEMPAAAPVAQGKDAPAKGSKILAAEAIGETIAAKLKEKGVTNVVFDRNGFLYHGRVRAVADAARKAGLNF
ncbi:50S ribosomal protein L18 [bacterium]|nr:50S ribosomal protein L18 [bacterium]